MNNILRKKIIRKEIIKKRDLIDKNQKIVMENLIKDSLLNSSLYKSATNIFIYVGFGSEINTSVFIQQFFKDQKNVLIPRTEIETKTMEAVRIDSLADLVEDKYGILEPSKSIEAFPKEKIDLIILPGVAFSKDGGRIGYGGGYYDKYLKSIDRNVPKVALCFDFQVVQDIPLEEHDVMADYVITEKEFAYCK